MTEAPLKTISWRWLLSLHLIVPGLLMLWLVDNTFFDNALKPYMGMGALLLPLYLLVFELPHIIGSLLTFADAEYVRYYRAHLFFGIPVLLALVGGLLYAVPALAFLFYILATMYHVLRQQTGIASILAGGKGFVFNMWTASMILATSTVLAITSVPEMFSLAEVQRYSLIALLAVGLSTLFGIIFALKSKTILGRYYVLATTAMVATSYFFALVSYFFLAVFVIRFVHDVTAFTFYMVHDKNRNESKAHNYFYALLAQIKIPLLVGLPLTSILLALLLRVGISGTVAATAVTVLFGFAHYYVEAIMWKRGSPHRQQISFSG